MDTVEIVILLIALIFVITVFVIVYILIFFKNHLQTNKNYFRKNQSLQIGSRLNQNTNINQLESKLLTMLHLLVAFVFYCATIPESAALLCTKFLEI